MILDKFKLDGKIALITGASRGLGQGMALGLAEAGADIVGVSRSSCDDTAAQVEALERRFIHLPCDLMTATVEDLQRLVSDVVAQLGGLNILINVAGLCIRHPMLEYPESDWDAVMQVNLKSLMFLSQAAAVHFAANGGGKIINVASALTYQGGLYVPSYTASKHGVLGVTRAMANELAPMNINVNAIVPGYMLTSLTAAIYEDPVRNPTILARIPAGHWGKPEDLKGVAVFLSSEASDYCHASTFEVDGGWLSR